MEIIVAFWNIATSLINLKQIKMKKEYYYCVVLFMTLSYAQEIKQVSQISVTGEGK
jgi:hypothetical protein